MYTIRGNRNQSVTTYVTTDGVVFGTVVLGYGATAKTLTLCPHNKKQHDAGDIEIMRDPVVPPPAERKISTTTATKEPK